MANSTLTLEQRFSILQMYRTSKSSLATIAEKVGVGIKAVRVVIDRDKQNEKESGCKRV